MRIKICLNYQWPMLIGRDITDWYAKILAFIGVITVFSILFPKCKPCPNTSIITSTNSIVYLVAPVHIGIFTCSEYSARKGATVHSYNVNDIGRIFLPKKCVSVWLSISVENSSQWIFSCFLEFFPINILDSVLILYTSNCRMRP